jgi:8-oxo-dGTP diphosphatase
MKDDAGTGAAATHAMGAASVIVRSDRVLLVKHNYGRHNWEIPGGLSEAGESAEETAIREVREELGVEVVVEKLTGVYWEPGWRGIGGHHFVFRCRLRDGAVPRAADPNEIADVMWCSIEDLPRPISDFTIERIKDALSGDPPRLKVVRPRTWLEPV